MRACAPETSSTSGRSGSSWLLFGHSTRMILVRKTKKQQGDVKGVLGKSKME